MRYRHLPLLVFLLFGLALSARPAAAHFVWVDIAGEGDARTARVMFGEDAQPGEPHLLSRIAKTVAQVQLADGSRRDLKLSPPADTAQPAVLSAPLPAEAVAVDAACDYGVYTRAPGGVRLQYFAKCVVPGAKKTVAAAVKAAKMEIVPTEHEGKVDVTVRFEGKSDPTAELVAIGEDGTANEVKLDADGAATIDLPKKGHLALRAKHAAANESGEIGDHRYAQTWYYATLVMGTVQRRVPVEESSSTPSARELLRQARDARAIWRDFPGFTTELTVRSDNQQFEGQAKIDSSGVVDVSGARSPLHDWAEEQLQSLVQHRMPDGEVTQGHVTFVNEEAPHPLGRLIDLGDPERQSRYRLKDDVIMEVNRLAGPQRFTISVLSITRNAEGKYLPEAFTMTFWDVKTGELKQSLAFWNDWQRVGEFDLPRRIVEVAAGPGEAKTTELTLHDQRLLPPAKAAVVQP